MLQAARNGQWPSGTIGQHFVEEILCAAILIAKIVKLPLPRSVLFVFGASVSKNRRSIERDEGSK